MGGVLFLCKKNETYGFKSYTRRSSGLYNSTSFIVKGLLERGVTAEIAEVNDNNDIDREVTKHKPKVVIIEALWVVPEKFEVLKKLHPKVKWFVHMHSGLAFLTHEGIAMDWLCRYAREGVGILANSIQTFHAFQAICREERAPHKNIFFLPNVYIPHQPDSHPKGFKYEKGLVNIGCLGALRPLKNTLAQAMAAIEFCKIKGLYLHFYINSSRVETGGEPMLKNIRQLFSHTKHAKLIEIPWIEPEDLHAWMRKFLDLGMQVSLSETFNVVSADYVNAGLPIVVSSEVSWANSWCYADPHEVEDMVCKIDRVLGNKLLIHWNQYKLNKHSTHAQALWFKFATTELNN